MDSILSYSLVFMILCLLHVVLGQTTRFNDQRLETTIRIGKPFLDTVCDSRGSRGSRQGRMLCILDHLPTRIRDLFHSCLHKDEAKVLETLCSESTNLDELNTCMFPSQGSTGISPQPTGIPDVFTLSEITSSEVPLSELQTTLPEPHLPQKENEIPSAKLKDVIVLHRVARVPHFRAWMNFGPTMGEFLPNIPHMGGITPHMGGLPPHMGGMSPHIGGIPPHMGGIPPRMGGLPPHMGEMSPHMGGMSPHMGGFPPHMGVMPPHMGGMPPPQMGILPPFVDDPVMFEDHFPVLPQSPHMDFMPKRRIDPLNIAQMICQQIVPMNHLM